MKKSFLHIVLALVLAGSLLSCQQEGKIIPRKKMCKIYAQMFLADSWLLGSDIDIREKSDSTAFYEPIFNSFGYTTEDYLRSVEYYLMDPDRFSRMMIRTRDMLDAELKRLQAEQLKEKSAVDLQKVEEEEVPVQ